MTVLWIQTATQEPTEGNWQNGTKRCMENVLCRRIPICGSEVRLRIWNQRQRWEPRRKQKNGFTSRIWITGKIRTDDSTPLERFSLYAELPEGLSVNLNPEAVRVNGRGKYLSGEELSEEDFQNHVSYQVRSHNEKTMLAADFDFTGAPLEASDGVEAVLSFEAGLSYTDFYFLRKSVPDSILSDGSR